MDERERIIVNGNSVTWKNPQTLPIHIKTSGLIWMWFLLMPYPVSVEELKIKGYQGHCSR